MDGELTVEQALKFLGDSGKKYVPESDLIAAKTGLEGKVSSLQADVASGKSSLDDKHQEVLRAQAALTSAEGKLSDQSKTAEEIKALKQQLQDAATSRDEAKNILVVLRRQAIHERSKAVGKGIEMAELEKKTPEQLEALEEVLSLVKSGQTFDGGGGGGGTGPKLTGRQKMIAGLKEKE